MLLNALEKTVVLEGIGFDYLRLQNTSPPLYIDKEKPHRSGVLIKLINY
jgi:hypothetical protein